MLNILSALSWVSFPGTGAYCAAKSAEWSLTNALRQELAPQGTRVTALHVGYMDTDMIRHLDVPKSDPADIAKIAIDGIEAGDAEIIADEISRQVLAGLSGGSPASTRSSPDLRGLLLLSPLCCNSDSNRLITSSRPPRRGLTGSRSPTSSHHSTRSPRAPEARRSSPEVPPPPPQSERRGAVSLHIPTASPGPPRHRPTTHPDRTRGGLGALNRAALPHLPGLRGAGSPCPPRAPRGLPPAPPLGARGGPPKHRGPHPRPPRANPPQKAGPLT